MEKGELHGDQGGYDGISPDQRAILGQIGPEGFYVQCGFNRNEPPRGEGRERKKPTTEPLSGTREQG